MDKNVLKEYAGLIAQSGLAIMPGQTVVIRTAPEQLEFLEMLTEECYKAGAGKVIVDWRYQPLTCLAVKYEDDETLGTVESFEEERLKYMVEKLPATVYLDSEDPDGLKDMDQDKWARARQAKYKVTRPYSDAMENKHQWCVAAVPGVKWARKVFPGFEDAEAVEKLWQAIISCSRAEKEPVEAWKVHSAQLHERCAWLNSLNLTRLEYKSESSGTDFSVGLMPEMLFCGGSEKLLGHDDVYFNANIPSEEVFTTPRCGDAEGVVYSTMPLSYRGVLIENFSLRFEKGRVVEAHAEKNEEALKLMLFMDDRASMLGECAFVPWNSPIRESGILFYNTLFDENASCHLALGAGYSSCLKDFEKYSVEEARALGVNDSMIHEDFMIGAPDLSVVGICADGSRVQIFKDGNWAK